MKPSTKRALAAVCIAAAALVGCGGPGTGDGSTGNHDATGHGGDTAPLDSNTDAGTGSPDACVAPAFAMCMGVCYEVVSDYYHCGACTTACQTGQTCMNGMCVGTGCPSPTQLSCGGHCIEVLGSDQTNCGGCGVMCTGDQSCHMGTCR